MMSVAERQAVVRRHLEAENAFRLEETLETLTPDCVFEDMPLGERVSGQTAAAAYYQRWWRAFPDLTWVPQRRAFTDEGIVSELIARGTHKGDFFGLAPTGRAIALPVTIFVSFADGRMSGERLYYDLVTLLGQLGVRAIPPALLPAGRSVTPRESV
jgi:steroid delta-isomerase-like uncharacterized protein